MKELWRRALAGLTAFFLLFSQVPPVFATETAATMKLTQTEGSVTVCNASGRDLGAKDDMRLFNGYTVSTGAASYAWINLDDTKLVKLDESSSVEVRKSGKKLEVMLLSGNIYTDVSKPLEEDESYSLRASTAIVGIRGTKVVVKKVHERVELAQGGTIRFSPKALQNVKPEIQISVPSGSVTVTVSEPTDKPISLSDPRYQNITSTIVNTLQKVTVPVSVTVNVPKVENVTTETVDEDIPGFAQTEMTSSGNTELQLNDGTTVELTPEQAQAQQQEDQAANQAKREENNRITIVSSKTNTVIGTWGNTDPLRIDTVDPPPSCLPSP